ncbi:casein kinase [Ceratobasidium sp. AG-Ba]|nr:casein kinase [Ceratobasidium sp. AG-Ba]
MTEERPPNCRTVIRRLNRIGSGGFGIVFRATDNKDGRISALKQSRVSLRIKRPILQHEAAILKLLAGHEAIPILYAYGRIEHFELIAMELFHKSLGDIVKTDGPLPLSAVLTITNQMLSGLEHLKDHGLVHRDIKPDNILQKIPGSWNVCLIDFGLAYPQAAPTSQTRGDDMQIGSSPKVFGTIAFASLNAHKTRRAFVRASRGSTV